MKKMSFIFILSFGCFIAYAQSDIIKRVFRLLPAGNVYNLSIETRDSMLNGKTYYPASNDSNEVLAYNYGSSEFVNDYLYISLSYETGQRATGMIEIRSLKMTTGDNMIIVSQTGGVSGVIYDQQSISTFIYSKNKKLIPYKKNIMPSVDEHKFFKKGIPDSAKKEIAKNANIVFDLSVKKITLSIYSQYISENESFRKWLKGDCIYYDWIKDDFILSKIEFQ